MPLGQGLSAVRFLGGFVGLTLLLSACNDVVFAPSEPFAFIAVRSSARSDGLEVINAHCPIQPITQIRMIRIVIDDAHISDDSPILWQQDFVTPSSATSFIVGDESPGGRTTVPLVTDLTADVDYAVFLLFVNGAEQNAQFKRQRIDQGEVQYNGEYLSNENFMRSWSCKPPSAPATPSLPSPSAS